MTKGVFVVMDIDLLPSISNLLRDFLMILALDLSKIKESKLATLLDLEGVNSSNPNSPRVKWPLVNVVTEVDSIGPVSIGSMFCVSLGPSYPLPIFFVFILLLV
jgi:hypothetical protein